MWCVQVPTGAFVARRNGHIFITGNSGFPKSLDISKAIDKQAGAERKVIGKSSRHGGGIKGNGTSYELPPDIPYITAPATEEAKQWDGWGTALKPANEPIVLARKPLSEKTIADNVLKWGTGGINIDGCRIPTEDSLNGGAHAKNGTPRDDGWGMQRGGAGEYIQPTGRFPANVILDEEAGKMLDEQSGILKSGSNNIRRKEGSFFEHGGLGKAGDIQVSYGDIGGASRFFYCAKASKKERGEGNNHPTVKPISLIKYLITLVTPPNGTSLDPFEGSGTHAKVCKELGFNYLGFEIESAYCEISDRRVNNI
jgi:site-specific DNA-methyltransferase (adenine-specific)